MRYTKPAFENEAVEVIDVIQASSSAVIETIQKEITDPETNEKIVVDVTQVTFDFNNLFR